MLRIGRRIAERPKLLLGAGVVLAVAAFQLWITPSNPPGYHRDEAALSYNAYTLSTGLRDEDGARLPLFFRSFGDYKSPLYPYVLAAVFAVTGPSGQVARGLSAVLVLAAVLVLGVLAKRLTGSTLVALVTVVLAGLTPWLFELGRVALEVSTQPVIVVVLLLVLLDAWQKARWTVSSGAAAGVLLALLVYSYTGSRLLGPLLAAALVVFAGSGRWRWLIAAWGTFAVLLLPLAIYALRHPGALTARYEATTIAREGLAGPRLVVQAVSNWLHDLNLWHWATAGDPAPYVHNGGYGAFYAAAVALAIGGAALVLARMRSSLWWRYVLLATLLVPIPAALTVDRYNAIRLAALPVFLLVLAIPALDTLLSATAPAKPAPPLLGASVEPTARDAARRSRVAQAAAGLLAVAVVVQFVQFVDAYRTRGPARIVLFEAGVEPLLRPVFAAGETIYIDYDDRGAQAKARWHAAEADVPESRIVVLPDGGIPPPGSVVFARFQECDYVCDEFARWDGYWLARAVGPRPG